MNTAVAPPGLSEMSPSFVEHLMAQSKAEHEQLTAKLDARDVKIDALMAQLAPPSISPQQLTTLQTRLEGLHAAELLSVRSNPKYVLLFTGTLTTDSDLIASFSNASSGAGR